MVAAADAAEVEEAEQEEPIAGPSGLCRPVTRFSLC